MSFIESLANVFVGFALAFATQLVLFPIFGVTVSFGESVVIGCVFTAVSLARSYMLRRLFEALRVRAARKI